MLKWFMILTAVSAIGITFMCRNCSKNQEGWRTADFDIWWGPGSPKAEDKAIKPFTINVDQQVIDDLNKRLDNTRLSSPLEEINFEYGFNTDTLKKVIKYWRNDYKWAERQTFLNQFPQFKTNIQGLDIHYIHVKPKLTSEIKRTVPLMLLHGWPGSVREFYEIIPLLTQVAPGKDYAFEVIVPSLPGYAFSSPAAKPGLGAAQMAFIFGKLMSRLNHEQYYLQGGDWGSQIASHMSLLFPDNVLGLHLNMCTTFDIKSRLIVLLSSFWPSLFMDEFHAKQVSPAGEKFSELLLESGYLHIQATKPDTVGVGLGDSPAGLAAYILEKFSTGTNRTYRGMKDGALIEKYTMTDLLDNVMIYWVNNCMTSAVRIYAENYVKNYRALNLDTAQVTVPTYCSKFATELAIQPDWVLKRRYPNLVKSRIHDFGGHFAAFENPKTLAEDIWDSFEQK